MKGPELSKSNWIKLKFQLLKGRKMVLRNILNFTDPNLLIEMGKEKLILNIFLTIIKVFFFFFLFLPNRQHGSGKHHVIQKQPSRVGCFVLPLSGHVSSGKLPTHLCLSVLICRRKIIILSTSESCWEQSI